MELLTVGLWGYKRFEEDEGNLDVTGNPIAIVGPNEVGKTSFLKALLHLEHDEAFDRSELTRQGDGKVAVRALYALDDEDGAAIAEVGGIGTPTTFTLYKREGGPRCTKLEPALERDLAPRETVVALIRRLFSSRWMKGNVDDDLVERLTKLHDDLVGDDQSLDDEVIEAMRDVAAELEKSSDAPGAAKRLIGQLNDLAKHEEAEHPSDAARDILFRRRPRFLWFHDDRRQVETPYSFGDTPSPALSNLLALVNLDLPQLRRAVQANDQATAAEMVDAANRAFADLFTGRWRQANVQVHLHLERDLMHIYVINATRRMVPIAERSEGLRHFIALLAFVEYEAADEDAIVLVDEAEQHLHYDAQADLIRVFSEQTVAKKIVYSTHSAGCLPHDLGTGVRVLEPVGPNDVDPSEWDRSRIRNWFWTEGPGFSPLLLAMGASSFAFTSTRKAVIGEGISDVLLLPTLFREATGRDVIEFQIAPGLAGVSQKTLADLDFVAARVTYLVDDDEGGDAKRRQLLEANVPVERIFVLGKRSKLTLEDVIRKELYLAAVNKELRLRHGVEIPATTVPNVGRKKAVEQWCDAQVNADGKKVERPSERAIAHHLFDKQREARLRGEVLQLLEVTAASKLFLLRRPALRESGSFGH